MMNGMNEVEQRAPKYLDDSDETDEEEEERNEEKTFAARLWNYLSTAMWLGVAGVCTQQSDMVGVLLHSNLVRTYVLYVAYLLLGLTFIGGFYITFVFSIAIWPVYHMMTFPLMFVMFMGFVHLLYFIPGSAAPSVESSKKK